MNTQDLIKQIQSIASPEDMQRVDEMIRAEPGPMAPEVQTALLDKLKQVTTQSRNAQDEVQTVLVAHGVSYPLTDWLTPSNYARKFGLKGPEVVTNWISRGVVPADHVKEIPELGVRLVRAVEYSPRPYAASTDQKDA